jgi:hypothetical protein
MASADARRIVTVSMLEVSGALPLEWIKERLTVLDLDRVRGGERASSFLLGWSRRVADLWIGDCICGTNPRSLS